MALSTCRDCNREVSTLAHHCVHCGRPRPTGTSSCSVITGIVTVVVALALTGAVVFAARKACKRLSDRASMECRVGSRSFECSNTSERPRSADKASFIKMLEEEGAELIDLGRGLFRLQTPPKAAVPATKAPEAPKEEQK